MNQAPQIEVVELGDVKQETKGLETGPQPEDNPVAPRREEI